MNRLFPSLLLCSAALLGAAATAQAAVNPPIRVTHGVEYMSGGIGKDEAELMETVAPRWAASFEFATKDRKGVDFAADVRVTVRDSGGAAVLDNVISGGPFMVARLEPGDYQIEAQLGGQMLKQPLHVVAGESARATFLFPAGTGMASAAR
ncbi:hypothetical protein [Variovorax sp. PAMC 28711]|uniref:hypothetical protein n=1 Tax=Variovorax sp. PAMC 28711 TaxID=1795631 RepID=UPI00078E9060|nr:hypothetical protein [Variovorax sp. PAMC 28711]AMM24735.1 hypothetical protein AX767_10495 [Variovorax sp. PAMC 28711]